MNIKPGVARVPLVLVVGAAWLAIVASLAVGLAFDYRLSQVDRGDLTQFDEDGVLFGLPVLVAALVGSALALRHPRHPVGWLFLGLALAIVGSAPIDGYAAYGAEARPGSLW